MADDAASTWDEAKVAELRRLWGEGLSASRIAAELGFATRNMVCGKLHRLGLSKTRPAASQAAPAPRTVVPRERPSPPQRLRIDALTKPVAIPPARSLPVAEAPQPASAPHAPGELVSLHDLKSGMCRWPVGDPMSPGFGFCGGNAREGGPYCEGHATIAYDTDRYRSTRRLRG